MPIVRGISRDGDGDGEYESVVGVGDEVNSGHAGSDGAGDSGSLHFAV
jgi:hypothetical protein